MPAEPASRSLLVDDDQIRSLLATAPAHEGHTVDGRAGDSGEALALHPNDPVLRAGTNPRCTVPL